MSKELQRTFPGLPAPRGADSRRRGGEPRMDAPQFAGGAGAGPCLGHRPLPDKRFRNVRRAARAPAGTGPRRPSGGERAAGVRLPGHGRTGAVRRGYQRRVGQMRQPGAVAALVGLPPRRPVARGGAEAVPDPFRALLRGVHGRGASGDETYLRDIESERPSQAAQARELWLQTENLWTLWPGFVEALQHSRDGA